MHDGLDLSGRAAIVLPAPLVALIEDAERKTARCRRLHLRLALDYSSRRSSLETARRLGNRITEETFSEALGPDVDLLIRTSGEQRLSDFLLWECAYAELVFTPRMWPVFTGADLSEAIDEVRRRDRRFGRVAAESEARRTA